MNIYTYTMRLVLMGGEKGNRATAEKCVPDHKDRFPFANKTNTTHLVEQLAFACGIQVDWKHSSL